MVNQLPDRDRLAEVVKLGKVLADLVVQREFALLGQPDDGVRRELLAHRADVKDRARRDRDVVLEVGHAVAFGIEDAAASHHGDRAARGIRLGPLGKEGIDLGGDRGGIGLAPRQSTGSDAWRERQEEKGQDHRFGRHLFASPSCFMARHSSSAIAAMPLWKPGQVRL